MKNRETSDRGQESGGIPALGLDAWARRFSGLAGKVVLLFGGLVLVGGWLFDIEALRSFPFGAVSMKANAALGLAAAARRCGCCRKGRDAGAVAPVGSAPRFPL